MTTRPLRNTLLGGVLAVLLAVGLCGCGGSGASTPAPEPSSGDWGHLRWNQGSWR